jgi:hypothetical protein
VMVYFRSSIGSVRVKREQSLLMVQTTNYFELCQVGGGRADG